MPLFVCLFLGILFCLATCACVILPLILSFWQISVAPARNVPARPLLKELCGTVLGIVAVDSLLYVMYRPTLPRHFFYGALIGLNGLCLMFVCYGFVAWWLYRRAIRNAPAVALEDEAAAPVRTSAI